MKIIFALFTTVVLGISAWFGHSSTPTTIHKFHGTITDTKGEVIVGLPITTETSFSGQRLTLTDSNGNFYMELPTGDHVLKVDSPVPYDLRAFIRITEDGPNPDNVEFVVDPSRICCSTASGQTFPKPLSLPKPAYPAAAKAIRTSGEVVVQMKVGREGKVISAETLSGHPLLRSAAKAAAEGSLFEASDQEEREARLVYVYLLQAFPPNARSRYTNPFRIEIIDISVPMVDG